MISGLLSSLCLPSMVNNQCVESALLADVSACRFIQLCEDDVLKLYKAIEYVR